MVGISIFVGGAEASGPAGAKDFATVLGKKDMVRGNQ